VQQLDGGVDPQHGGLQMRDRRCGVDLQRDDVRVVGDEVDEVELAEDAADHAAVANEQAMHAMVQHQPERIEDLGRALDLDQVEAGNLAHLQRCGRFRTQ